MRRRRSFAAAAAGSIAVLAATASVAAASSHREAPLTSLDPTADDTDVYAFVAPDATDSVTIAGNWIPFEDPAGGPNFYRFDDRATYYLNVDNTGDGRYDVRYRFRFTTEYRNPGSFLYALPGVTSFDDPKLQVVQTYQLKRLVYRKGRRVDSDTLVDGAPVAPSNVGPKTFPDYGSLAAAAVTALPGGGKVFAGQRDDPFFVDLGATFDGLTIRNGTGNAGGGKDDLATYNVNSIVLQVPKSDVTRDGKGVRKASSDNAVVGVWADTERPSIRVDDDDDDDRARSGGDEVQVSRLGNPLVNEVVIPIGKKDFYNATEPSDDGSNFGAYVLEPELAKLLNALYHVGAPETNRVDIVTALLTGIPGLTQIAPGAPPTDTLKLNLGVPPSPMPSRFGVLGGDTAGFPNGRRLADDVTDIEERVVAGALVGNAVPLGDGVDQNDRPFLTSFPYLAAPTSGIEGTEKRIEPIHPPDARR
jgi:hypothetical protein